MESKVKVLIVDSGPLIKEGVRIKDYSESFITIPEVFKEIRDKQSRQQLAMFPYEIQVKSPSEEAMKAVVRFAKKTDDFHTLSTVDLKVLALTYMLEKEYGDISKVRLEPVKAKVAVGGIVAGTEKVEEKKQSEQIDDLNEKLEGLNVEEENNEKENEEKQRNITQEEKEIEIKNDDENSKEEEVEEEKDEKIEEQDDDESDGEEWITPSNLKQKQLEFMGDLNSIEKEDLRTVACITTDFAMQNVLLQMNLGLISLEGLAVKQIKSFVLRCHACFHITTNMEKRFCPRCGGNTLNRVTSSVDKDGNVKYFLKKNYQYNLRGIKYSIPTPKGGHKNKDLILAEDQKEFIRGMKNYNHRKETDLFDPDFLPGIVTGKQTNNFAPPTIGYGRKNPNKAKRRSGRKKS